MEGTPQKAKVFHEQDAPVCAVTGSSGYVGGLIKRYFETRGWKTVELTRRPSRETNTLPFQLGEDVSPDALRGVRALVHCAYDFKPVKWRQIQSVNVEGTRKLLSAAREAGVQKIVCISSISAFAGCRSLYGQAKLEIEQAAFNHCALVVRPGLVYGNGTGGMFGKLVDQVRNASVLPLIGDGSQVQYLIHGDDLAGFIERYARGHDEPAVRILVGANEQPWLFRTLLETIAQKMKKSVRFAPVPWQLIWGCLKVGEVCHLPMSFRSDSVISLVNQDPSPEFVPSREAGLLCRPLCIDSMEF